MKRVLSLFILFALLGAMLTLVSCGGEEEMHTESFFAMDTYMEITVPASYEHILDNARALVEWLDDILGWMNPDSPVYRLNYSGELRAFDEAAEVFPIVYELLSRSVHYSALTGGAFDVTVRPLTELWNVTGGRTSMPDEAEIAEALALVDYTNIDAQQNHIWLRGGATVDLGAIAKGHAAQMVFEMLIDAGVTSGLINLGGTVAAIGNRPDGNPWRIGIQNPFGEEVVGVVPITNQTLTTSGDNQRFTIINGQRVHHIMDPFTGHSADAGLSSVTLISNDVTMGDAVSCGLFVMGLERAMAFYHEDHGLDFEAVFVTTDGRIVVTPGLSDRFEFMGEELGLIYED